MKRLFTVAALAAVYLALTLLASAAPPPEAQNGPGSKVARLKLFNFEQFKETFNKHYPTLVQEAARCRIFLANAFKVFTRWIQFINKKVRSFMRINEMSDWTQKEVSQLYNYRGLQADPIQKLVVEEALDLNQLESEMDEISKHKGDSLAFDQVARELEQPGELDRLVPSKADLHEVEKPSDKLTRRIDSNNPTYEAPDVTSMGDDYYTIVVEPEVELDTWRDQTIDLGSVLLQIGGWVFSTIQDAIRDQLEPNEDDALIEPELVVEQTRVPLPDEVFVDHSRSDCISAVRNQGRCGSCYIFSTIALLEWEYCKQTGSLVEFSEQFAMDCGRRANLKGCGGGKEVHVLDFVQEYGLELRSNYPYVMREEECPYEPEVDSTRMGYLKAYDLKYKTIWLKDLLVYLKDQPILVGVYISDVFKQHGGGVDSGDHCDKKQGHAMLLVGHGREDGREYWLFKNSHGHWWGDKGYYKLDKEAGHHCLMDGIGWVLTDGFKSNSATLRINPIYESQPIKSRQEKNRHLAQ